MASSKKVYLTDSAFYAFINRVHTRHNYAQAFFRYFAQEEYALFTDTETITQAYNQIYKEVSPALAKDFLRTIFISDINIIYPDESDIKAALKTLVNYQSLDLTFSQALMAVLANRRGVPQIATFDYLHPLFGLNTFFLPI
jgi:predicted nucleic acid-binding protein